MPPFRAGRSSVHARSKRSLFVRRAPLALSTLLRQRRILHPLTPTRYFQPPQLPPLLPQISPARSPFRRPIAPSPPRSVDIRPQRPGPVAHSQTPPPKSFPARLPPPWPPTLKSQQSACRKPPPMLSLSLNPLGRR